MFKKLLLRELRKFLEKEGANKLVNARKDVLLEHYKACLDKGFSPDGALLSTCKRLITHII